MYHRTALLKLTEGCCYQSEVQQPHEAGRSGAERHSGLVVSDGESRGYISIATGEVSGRLCVTPGSHSCVHYGAARMKLLREIYLMEAVETTPRSVFVGHRYVQPAGGKWCDEHFIGFHSCLTLESQDL